MDKAKILDGLEDEIRKALSPEKKSQARIGSLAAGAAYALLEQLKAEALQERYACVGIYEKGDILVPDGDWSACLLDCTWEMAFVKEDLNARKPDEAGPFGLKLYYAEGVPHDIYKITDPDCWQLLDAMGLLSQPCRTDPLEAALRSFYPVPHGSLDLLLKRFPAGPEKLAIMQVKTKSAAEWMAGKRGDI